MVVFSLGDVGAVEVQQGTSLLCQKPRIYFESGYLGFSVVLNHADDEGC